ncbi:MAG: Crp/Fnr family transcriptional regulator [Clostridiales bacterium]|nr:Crp/Fnr family transcriptional regulator [Clostridiales bacterium]
MECKRCGEAYGHAPCVHKVPVFSPLAGEDLARIASLIRHQEYRRGDVLFREGDALVSLTIVNRGTVKAYRVTPDGREQILYVFSPGDFFGERNLFGAHAAPYTVEALDSVKTCSFSRESFRALLREHPDIAIKIIEELEERMARMENAFQRMGVRSVDGRISALLIDFADRYGAAVPEGVLIQLPLSREGMANHLGIARETVSRKLGQLESDGVIRSISNKSILLLDRRALAAAADMAD